MSGREQDEELGEFALDLDDDLLQAAVSAVDARLGPQRGQRALTLDDALETEELQAEIEATFAEAHESVARLAEQPPDATLDVEISLDEVLSAHTESETLATAASIGPDPALLREILSEDASDALREDLEQARSDNGDLREQLAAAHTALEQAVAEGEKHKKRAVKLSVLRKRLQDGYDTMALRLEDQRVRLGEWEVLIGEQRAAMARLEAERERLKTRYQRELFETRQYGQDRTFRELLPVMDNLDLTLQHAESTPPEKMVEGVGMVLSHLQQTLTRMGLTRHGAEGDLFDPMLHEAIRYEADPSPSGTITVVHQPGYQLTDRLMRAARVTVSSGPESLETPVDQEEEVDRPSVELAEE